MNRFLIGAGILFAVLIFRVIVDILILFLNISDYTRGYAVGFITTIFLCWMVERYLP